MQQVCQSCVSWFVIYYELFRDLGIVSMPSGVHYQEYATHAKEAALGICHVTKMCMQTAN